MEPFRKRQRLYSPMRHEFSHSYDDRHGYHDEAAQSGYEAQEDYDEPISDPDAELEQRRARLDFKLKSTFEAIFEKYEKDFDGVGDEIDLATEELLVNNGHLLTMQDERDAGDLHRGRQNFSEDTTEPEDGLSSSVADEDLEQDDIEDEVEDEDSEDAEDAMSDDEMMEDDIILRGFAKASQFLQPVSNLEPSDAAIRPKQNVQHQGVSHLRMQGKPIPTQEDILAQFGPQLGPEIIKYVSKQNVLDAPEVDSAWQTPDIPGATYRRHEDDVEPAWRVPDLPIAAPKRRPVLKSVFQPEIERSPSPDTHLSIWAPAGQRRRRRRGITKANDFYLPSSNDFTSLGPQAITGLGSYSRDPRQRRRRHRFTAEEDRIMLDLVIWTRKHHGRLPLSLWEELEAKFPHHPWTSWKNRWQSRYAYMEADAEEDLELSTSETSQNVGQFLDRQKSSRNLAEESEYRPTNKPVQVSDYQRPVRARKPAQRDSRIISWSEAVDTIKYLDPDLHAGMRADAGNNLDEGSWVLNPRGSSSGHNAQHHRVSAQREDFEGSTTDHRDRYLLDQSRKSFRNFLDKRDQVPPALGFRTSDGTDVEDVARAPCPHVACRPSTNNFYRLQRLANEEQSQMSLHLRNAHHTAPFPCCEIGCSHQGEHGYFMQTDLVRHVKSAHPSKGALHRLRGRVDPELLGKGTADRVTLKLPSNFSNPRDSQPPSDHKDSDFMSPSRPCSSHILLTARPSSRSSELDRTLTPRGTTAASTHTPMTSISSLMVNQHSAPLNPVASLGSRERYLVPNRYSQSADLEAQKIYGDSSAGLGPNEDEQERHWHNEPSPDLGAACRNESERSTCIEDARANVNGEVMGLASMPGRRNEQLVSLSVTQISSPNIRPSLPASIPNSQSPMGEMPSSSGRGEIPRSPSANTEIVSQGNSWEKNKASLEVIDGTSMLPPKESQKAAKLASIATPVREGNPQNLAASNTIDMDDADELSLVSDGFLLLSARPRTAKTPLDLPVLIKREDTVDIPQNVSNIGTRKRKLQDFQGSDELDELVADEPNFSVTRLGPFSRPKIKTEPEASNPVFVPALLRKGRIKTQPKMSSRARGTLAYPTPVQAGVSPSHGNDVVRASTPLLDLTPKRRKSQTSKHVEEIAESNQGSSSPLAEILTPLRKKTQNGPEIVIKTPGGTYRKCGENGFACKRSFCLRCGSTTTKSTV